MHTTVQNTAQWVARRQPNLRAPQRADFLAFFLGVPVALAFLFSLVGIRLINGMPYFAGLLYMLLHMLIAWWAVSLGAWAMYSACRSWKPPVVFLCILGFAVSLVPAAFVYKALGDFYGSVYPVFASNRADAALPGWGLEYIVRFLRYSLPAVVLFVCGVKSYRYITGVEWFGYSRPREQEARDGVVAQSQLESGPLTPMALLVEGTRLPIDAELIAVKADQHYVHIWSNCGTDMVRYRFRDLMDKLQGCNGTQVHRSWWVNFDQVRKWKSSGRHFELEMADDLTVPVSVAYRNKVREELDSRGISDQQP